MSPRKKRTQRTSLSAEPLSKRSKKAPIPQDNVEDFDDNHPDLRKAPISQSESENSDDDHPAKKSPISQSETEDSDDDYLAKMSPVSHSEDEDSDDDQKDPDQVLLNRKSAVALQEKIKGLIKLAVQKKIEMAKEDLRTKKFSIYWSHGSDDTEIQEFMRITGTKTKPEQISLLDPRLVEEPEEFLDAVKLQYGLLDIKDETHLYGVTFQGM